MKPFLSAPLAAALWLALPVGSAQAAAIVRPASSAMVVPAATLGSARDLGHAANSRVDFAVVLPYRHPSDLPLLLALQRNPASRYFHHYLKAAEFRAYFSPTQAAYSAAAASLQKAGFHVNTFANRTVLHATGTSKAAEVYFQTVIDAVRQPNGRLAYANHVAATIPTALTGARISGLNNIVTAQTAATQHSAVAHPHAAGPLFGPDGGYGPLAVNKAEDFPIEHGYTGRNSNVADIIDGSIFESDVNAFLTGFGIARGGPRSTKILVNGGCGLFCNDSFSATIDAEWTLASAPNASLFVYQLPFLSNSNIVLGVNAVASDDAVNIVDIGIGVCEITGGDLQLALTPLVAQGAAEGITFASITFGGANRCNTPPLALPLTPANLDTVTAVGGSNTIVDASAKELAASALPGSNGGVSITVPMPAFQSTTPGIDNSGRNVPDVVVPSSVDGTGPSVYFVGAWQGGFAFVNQAEFVGYLATVQEMYGYATPLGNVAPALYSSFDKYGYKGGTAPYFTDISTGCIGAVAGVPVCARSGYDIASGIGSIADGFALAKTLGYGPILPPTP